MLVGALDLGVRKELWFGILGCDWVAWGVRSLMGKDEVLQPIYISLLIPSTHVVLLLDLLLLLMRILIFPFMECFLCTLHGAK